MNNCNNNNCCNHMNNCVKKCIIQGPTGPQGATGATGSTGPTGPTGLQGLQGEKGEQGEAGKSDIIIIRNTITAEPGEVAKVIDEGEGNTHILDFIIPKGQDGDVGPQGIQGVTGPTGPQGLQGEKGEQGEVGKSDIIIIRNTITAEPGEVAKVIDEGEGNTHILDFIIPKGQDGDVGPQGIQGVTGPTGPQGLPGEIGRTEHILIDGTETVESTEEASIIDDFENLVHHLTFYIPKGEKGDKGDAGTIPIASYEGMLFASYQETLISSIMTIQEQKIIPDTTDKFYINEDGDILVLPGTYEINFSGAIEKVDDSHGGIFYLKDDKGQVIMDLSFKLLAGKTSEMHFSQTVIHEFNEVTVLQVQAGITGDLGTSNVVISDVNLLMKKIYLGENSK